jgi:tetratricopeptide (TPR) repeat protein
VIPLFRRRSPPERIATSFRWFEPRIFADVETAAYAARRAGSGYAVEVKKASYFAWETAHLDRGFDDFVLEAGLSIDPANGHSAAGFVLRYDNEENFYAFLVSNRGMYRFDLLFNNNPMPLIEWTPLPETVREGGERVLRVIAHGSHFSFYDGEEWVGEMEDETLASGGIGLAVQNFAEAGRAAFRFASLTLDARPLAVEREYLRWVHYVPHAPSSRLALAETLFSQGRFAPAAVELTRALKGRDGTAREHFLLAECYLRLSINDRALRHVEETLTREPTHAQALFEKANLLYITNELLRARDWINACLAAGTLPESPVMWNLLGNVEYGLGNWKKSADAYLRAAALQPDTPLFLRNAARSLEQAGSPAQALESYLAAARLLFREEAYGDLSLLLSRVQVLDPGNAEVRALEAKTLYHEGKSGEAFEKLTRLSAEGTADSAVEYLLGIMLAERGSREEALEKFTRAESMTPDFPLYAYRVAETLHLMGRDARPALERARTLDPEDPWINNLASLMALEAGNPEEAVSSLRRALERAPGEAEILINLSEALASTGRAEEALALVEGFTPPEEIEARLANQKGNILSRMRDFPRAVKAYEAAVRADPDNPVFKENCASALLEIDMVHRAEELLARAEEQRPSASIYRLLGNAAMLKGEYRRAEAAYRAGLDMEPSSPDLMASLASLQLERGRYREARTLVTQALLAAPGHAVLRTLRERIRTRHEERLACSSCGREWWVPRELPPQGTLVVRGEPPVEAPAGRCTACGKLYCVGCATPHLKDMRFHCAHCGGQLKLSDNSLRFLLEEYVGREPSS